MSRRMTWLLATGLWIACVPSLRAFEPQTIPADASDESRERAVMARFLGVLEKAPRRGTALDRVYGYHVERSSLDSFLKLYQDQVAADPEDGGSWLLIGLVETQRGREGAAIEAFRKAEAARRTDSLPAYYLGQALVLVGQPDAAAEAFERALARKPARADLLDIYQALGRVYQRAHRNDKALAVWDRLEKAFPDDPRVQEQIAHALADEGQDAPALARFEVLAKGSKDRFRQIQFAMEAASLKVKLGQAPEALADFGLLLGKLDPESWLYREVRRKVEEVFLRTDDLAGLASYYEGWIKKTPDDVEARARLGRTLAGQGRLAEARKWLDEAVKLAPSRRELRLALIEQLVLDRKFVEAASQYEALAKLEPNNPDVVRDWGRMLIRDTSKPEADRKQAAASVWRKLAPDDVKDAVVVAQAADLFRQAGLADEAIGLYLKAIKLAPDATQYREYLGEYYHTLKRPTDALATWRAIAEGPARNARTLGRLGEVLVGFGYRREAVESLVEACKLEPDDFDLRIKLADLRLALEQPTEALAELEKAEKAAVADEQAEAVLGRLIHAYQASGTLATRIEALQKSLETAPTAAGWTRLARLWEADQKATEAARAIGEATRLDPKSILAWVATARLREAAGDILGSADAFRTLITLDRRSRTDYLTGIAKLEARLGRRGPALEAGRELLAAAPGNPDHHQFFAELCFQLGEPEEGLDALRRAARANPSDPKAMLTLAENLARQFRAEEAIELFWRAFAKTPEIDGKLSIVARMADQYLQRNQLDRLLARLERELREPNQQRELSLYLSQAHATGGDYSTARLELERLLATNPRDIPLLIQLSNLAEQEGDLGTAARYQKLALDIAPAPEASARLAQLYLRTGDYLEAESLWTKASEGDQDPTRALAAIDSLLASGKREPVLLITGRLLRTKPDDWELLYREGVALAGLNRGPEADSRFRTILALTFGDDEKGVLSRSRGAGATNASMNQGRVNPGNPSLNLPGLPISTRVNVASIVRMVAGVDHSSRPGVSFSPLDFGQARLASMAWRFGLSQRESKSELFIEEQRQQRDKLPGDLRTAFDRYYWQAVRLDHSQMFDAAREIVKLLPSDEAAQWAFLDSLGNRTVGPNQQNVFRMPGATGPDPKPALASEDIERVLACYRGFRARRPDLVPAVLAEVLAELKRANRPTDADQIYREAMSSVVPGSAYANSLINIASERGDTGGLMIYLEKLERMPVTGATGTVNQSMIVQTYGRSIGIQGVSKAYPEVLGILDRFLAASTRSRAGNQAGGRGGSTARAAIARNNNGLAYWINGQASRGVAVDFPTPNERLDAGDLGVVRTAFEVFRRDDLLSDLFTHLQARADVLSGMERVDTLLALGYCRWWGDDKDEAEQAIVKAAEVAGSDPSVRMILAELQERQGSLADALATIDGIETVDSATVLKRENLALRLAVATGNVDRARKAAERLFGLRLDAEAQVQLAALMSQLGMHELAEAVLARARRSAGNKPPALLILMNQYQRQQKSDQSLQIALQILRLRPMSVANVASTPAQNAWNNANGIMPGSNAAAEDDAARREAIQVLSRSGKLNELVNRAEAQLQKSPNSIQVLQTLVEYARLANDREKTRTLFERMAKARPDDVRLRLQLAMQLVQGGDFVASLDHYRAIVKADPSIFASQLFPILNAYRQANKIEEFAAMIEGIDIHSIGNTNMLINLAQNLMNDPKVKDQGLALFRKMWATFPADRVYFVNLLNGNEEWWRLPDAYSFARDVVLPSPSSSKVKPWYGVDGVQVYGNDGRLMTLAHRLLDAATRQNRLTELEGEIREVMARHPEWAGGQVILALVWLREGRFDESRSAVLGPLGQAKEPMPLLVRGLLAQELEDHSQVQEMAEELYNSAMTEYLARTTSDPNDGMNPSPRILARYRSSGRLAEARDLLLKLVAMKLTNPMYDPAALEAQRIGMMGHYAQQLIGLGFPVDAIRLYREQMAAGQAMAKDLQSSMYINADGVNQQAQQGIQQALRASKPEALAATVASLLRPEPGAGKQDASIELYLAVPQVGFEKEVVTSGLVEVIRKVVGRDGAPSEVLSSLTSLVEQSPDDFAVNIVASIVGFAEAKPEAIDRATRRLVALVERTPLETLTSKPNARQRTDAAKQLGLWLVARGCWTSAGMKGLGDQFATRAVEAARRQVDPRWALAMLREWGRVDLDLGDRDQAERHWSMLLDLVLNPPGSKKPSSKKQNPGTISATPRENFDKALIVAKMAADHGLNALSIKAVREAFRGGAPVGLQLALDNANAIAGPNQPMGNLVMTKAVRTNRRLVATNDPGTGEAPTGPIEAKLTDLEELWLRGGVAPREVFEVLRDVVLPIGRPMDVDLYPLGLSQATSKNPRSLGQRLAAAAVRAGAIDNLREAIQKRRRDPIAELTGLVIRARLDLATGHPGEVLRALDDIATRLEKDTLKLSSELAAHAALPALEVAETEKSAEALLERTIKNLSPQPSLEPLGSLLLIVAGHDLDRGRLDEGRKRLRDYLDIREGSLVQNQNNPFFLAFNRRTNLLWVAAAYARHGMVVDALDVLGRYADIPTSVYIEPSPNGTLAAFAGHFSNVPAPERYTLLKDWTLPTASRNSIRTLVAHFAESAQYPSCFGPPRSIPSGAVFATPLLLIDAARQAGKLDELAGEVRLLEEKAVEGARPLLILIEIARGKRGEMLSKVELLAVELEQPAKIDPNLGYPPPPLPTALVAEACLVDDRLRLVGERLANALVRHPWSGNQNFVNPLTSMTARLPRAIFRSEAVRASRRDRPLVTDPGFGAWTPLESEGSNPFLGINRPAWFEHGGHVGLQGTNAHEMVNLAFAYPLSGTFEFSVDAQTMTPEGEAAVEFGGQLLGPRAGMGRNMMFNAFGMGNMAPGTPRPRQDPRFQRIKLRVEAGRVRTYVNGVLTSETTEIEPTSPWLSLSGRGRTSWRFPELTGSPEVPREVRLSQDDRLAGWSAMAYAEQVAQRIPAESNGVDPFNLELLDWSSRDGEIRGRRHEATVSLVNAQSRLAYIRPLQEGETLSYSFLHEPGRVEVHPALGCLVFLLEKEGVRLHWMTDSTGLDPSGLAVDNVADEPSSRRGTAPLPLRTDAWNVMKLALSHGTIRLELNGELVFERPMDSSSDRTFSLFHYKDRTESRVRDVVLRGTWPEKFEASRIAGFLSRNQLTRDDAERHFEHALIGETELTQDAEVVLRRTRVLPTSSRFDSLADWVLPGPDHPTIRLQGCFTPLDPAPTSIEESTPHSSRKRIQVGGEPESPAIDLVGVARVSGRLDELLGRVESARAESPLDERGRLALVAMIRLAQGKQDEAIAALARLKQRASTVKPADPDWMRWPELTAARIALADPKARDSAMSILEVPTAKADEALGASDFWVRQVRQARAVGEALGRGVAFGDESGLLPWAFVASDRVTLRGRGYPRSSWSSVGGVLTNQSGRGDDSLIYRAPLRGDFEASCELSTSPGREANLSYGGLSVRVRPDRKALLIRQDDQPVTEVVLSPPLEIKGDWATWKIKLMGGRLALSIDGRVVFERPVLSEGDPWLAIESPGPLGGSARNFGIVGRPTIPDRLRLSSLPELPGWSTMEYASQAVGADPFWRKRGDEIFGRSVSNLAPNEMSNNHNNFAIRSRLALDDAVDQDTLALPVLPGSKSESVVRYRRPLLEDATIDYEFYFEPGKTSVHPVLGRVALLLEAGGVSIHRLTDLPDDRSGLDPGNVTVEPGCRKGPEALPLRPKAWNRIKFILIGDLLTIALNDEFIYERAIEPTNPRTFGLFHYVDEAEARVRNISYQGDWPKTVPGMLGPKRE